MSTFSIGALNQLADALEKTGFTTDDVTKLKQFGNLKGIKDIITGRAGIAYPEHLIDCSTVPFIPEGWTCETHQESGLYKFNPAKISLYQSKKQIKGTIEGNKLRRELAGKSVLNANVLDYLLAHPDLIPEEWKGKRIYFWGTIYRSSRGDLVVRCLRWGGSQWDWSCGWLDGGFSSGSFAVLASS